MKESRGHGIWIDTECPTNYDFNTMKLTMTDIKKAIKNCEWKTDNRKINLLKGICTAKLMPCAKAIDEAKCPVLIELFRKENNESNSNTD